MSEHVVATKITDQAAKGGTLIKLIIFSISLAVVPISSYFLSEKYVWDGNSNYAAITAVVSANVVLVAYIILSVLEDNTSIPVQETSTETKKEK